MRKTLRYIKGCFADRFYLQVVTAVAITEALLISYAEGVGPALALPRLDPKLSFGLFTSIPLFVIGLMQLHRTLRLQRAAFVKDYISKFVTDEKLYDIFYDLVYAFHNDTYDKIDEIMSNARSRPLKKPHFEKFAALNGSRSEGSRFFHPDFFQGSPEEKRLDMMLGYLDVIGYYYRRNFISMEDVFGSLGYYLAVLNERKVIQAYLKLCAEQTKGADTHQGAKLGAAIQFAYLGRLLTHFRVYNDDRTAEIKAKRADVSAP